MNKAVQKSVKVVLSINGVPLAGQEEATLSQSMSPIDITNKISGEWSEYLSGIKIWNVSCSGVYVKNASALKALENAFLTNDKVQVKVILDEQTNYAGEAYITNFPLNSVYNDCYRYRVSLTGSGELKLSDGA